MIPRKMNKFLLAFIVILNSAGAFAQQAFKFKAAIEKVDSAGFYRIALSPDLLAKCNADLSDIRLTNLQGKPVPFIYGNQLPGKDNGGFIAFEHVAGAAAQTDSLATFIVQNKRNLTINQLNLRLRNTSAERMLSLSGSDDLTRWYAIKEDILLTGAGNNTNKTIYDQAVNFPASNYRYFKFSVKNNRKAPVNILQAGIYQFQSVKPLYTNLTVIKFAQKDTGKSSRIIIQLKDAYPVSKLHLTIAGAKYYKRGISVYEIRDKQRRLTGNNTLSSAGTGDLLVSFGTKLIELVIDNDDNPPLTITGINAFSLDQSIIAYLSKEQGYQLLFGDSLATLPNYDLKFFADSVQQGIAVKNAGAITTNPLYHTKKVVVASHFPAWLVWAAIILVLGLLGFVTYKMVKEIDKKKISQD